MKNIFVPFTA